MEDKRLCPHCGGELHRQPYLMSRRATENVLTMQQVAWLLAFVLVLVLITS